MASGFFRTTDPLESQMLRRTFLSTALSASTLLLVSLSLVACGGGGGDPVTPTPPVTGVNITNGTLDSMGQPNTQTISQVIITVQGNPAIDTQGLSIPVGGTQLIPVAIPSGNTTVTVAVHSIRYADSVLLGPLLPPTQIVLSEGDTPTYVAIYPVPPPP